MNDYSDSDAPNAADGEWRALTERAGVSMDDAHAHSLWQYIDLLLAANQRMNLTRIADRDDAALRHIADALTLLPFLPREPHRIADVGAGGGVPGIPLAIVRPDVHVTLIESTQKKAAFLRDAVRELKLTNVTVDPRRAEDVAHSDQRESFDIAVSRAVATLDWLAEWCLPLVKVGGAMLAMKGPKVQQELAPAQRAIALCGGGEPVIHSVALHGTTGHVIVEVRKKRPSGRQYPRLATHAKGKPLS